MNADLINGIFEFIGAGFCLLNCKRLYQDKTISGISPLPTVFFTSWGIWNLYLYPSIDFMWSFWGGVALATVNATWLGMVKYYTGFSFRRWALETMLNRSMNR